LQLALVDPDNRRPVDYGKHAGLLDELIQAHAERPDVGALERAVSNPFDPRTKLYVTWQLLRLRREHFELFAQGTYEPLQIAGEHKDHVLAFARTHGERTMIVVMANRMAQLLRGEQRAPVGEVWADTTVAMAREMSGTLKDVLTGAEISVGASLRASELFRHLPIAVLI
jgi:(1->4)-alpha-D-glucan 1-alpha-D-glucosylmutase